MLLNEPAVVTAVLEVEQSEAEFLDGVEVLEPEQLLLQGADESLGNTVSFGLSDERGRGADAEEAHLVLEVAAGVLAAMLVAKGEASCGAGINLAEVLSDALENRLQGGEAIAFQGRMDAAGRVEHTGLTAAPGAPGA